MAVLAVAISASAATPRKITGKLSRGGYTVIALGADGSATSVRARSGRFTLRPPAGNVTLHLRDARGRYAGPVVVGGKGARVIVGVKAGVSLGKVVVRAGYARPTRALRKKWLVSGRWAKAKRGVPIGARVFGFVRTSAASPSGPGLDHDRDGVPGTLDVDDDGDLVLDNLERTAGLTAGQYAGLARAAAVPHLALASSLNLDLGTTVNANVAALSDAQIDAALSTSGILRIGHPAGGETELDCGGLPYCSPGGTGKTTFAGPEQPFPSCCDPDSDGFGTMPAGPGAAAAQFYLRHGATTGQIRTGDVLIQRYPEDGVEKQVAVTLQTVFVTVPALISYTDGAGHSATITYPARPEIPLRVSAGTDGDVVLTLTFWRPQRKPIPGETGEWIDVGGLLYRVVYFAGPSPDPMPICPPSTYATSDPNLEPAMEPFSPGGSFRDKLADQPPNPANTLTFSVNMTDCLAWAGRSWNPGGLLSIQLTAGGNVSDHAFQGLHFMRES